MSKKLFKKESVWERERVWKVSLCWYSIIDSFALLYTIAKRFHFHRINCWSGPDLFSNQKLFFCNLKENFVKMNKTIEGEQISKKNTDKRPRKKEQTYLVHASGYATFYLFFFDDIPGLKANWMRCSSSSSTRTN